MPAGSGADGDRQAQGGSRSLETMRQGHLRNQVGTSMSSRYGPARSLARARVVPNMAGASRTEKQVLCREALGAQKRRWKRGRLVAYYKLLRMSAIALTRFSPAQRPRPLVEHEAGDPRQRERQRVSGLAQVVMLE